MVPTAVKLRQLVSLTIPPLRFLFPSIHWLQVMRFHQNQLQ